MSKSNLPRPDIIEKALWSSAMGKIVPLLSFYKDGFGIR